MMARVLEQYPEGATISTIHATAIISSEARLAPDVTVGPFATIEGEVTVGGGSVIHGGARLIGPLVMGERNVVHANAVLGGVPQDRKFSTERTETIIGEENVFREGVTVHRATGKGGITRIGSRCYLMVNSHVGHNCTLADDVTLVNGAVLGGHVQVGPRAMIGAYVAVHQFCRVGRLAMPSNACCMNVDLPPFFIAMETNKVTQLNAVGLRRSGMPKSSIDGLRKMFQMAFREGRGKPLKRALADLPAEVRAIPEVMEMMEFCETSKRGVALFEAWSGRGESGEEG